MSRTAAPSRRTAPDARVDGAATDPAWFRRVLGQYPTGVCIITAELDGGARIGMAVGSFTSASLDPPMVAFFPGKSSQTWPDLREARSWCVNILAADQDQLCRQFSTAPSAERFAGVSTSRAPSGAPVIDGAVAWIDCIPAAVHDAGDHYVVLAEVTDLQVSSAKLPLLFFRSGYGSFSPLTLTAHDTDGQLARPLRHFELVRSLLQRLPDQGLRCLVTARAGESVVVVGQLDPPTISAAAPPTTLVGQQLPFRPPGPSIFEAWSPAEEVGAWLARFSEEFQAEEHAALARIRARGFSIGLTGESQRRFARALEQLAMEPGTVAPDELNELIAALDYEPADLADHTLPAVRVISAPVFDESGRVVLVLTVFGFDHDADVVRAAIDSVTARAHEATLAIGGHRPG